MSECFKTNRMMNVSGLFRALLPLIIVICHLRVSQPIKCYVGYGQRGLKYSNEISWVRNCPQSSYCFEAVTFDVTKAQKLVNYPWNSYYSQFFIRSCGGDLGTELEYRPYRGKPRSFRALGIVKINITVDYVITGQGGTEEFYLKHACRKDLCLKGPSASGHRAASTRNSIIMVTALTVILSIFFSLQ